MLKALHLLQLTSRQGWLVFLFTAYLEFEGVVIRRLQGKPCEGLSSMFSERGEGHLSPLFSRNETYGMRCSAKQGRIGVASLSR